MITKKPLEQEALISLEAMCNHCEKHSNECPLNVARGELDNEYSNGNSPIINYKDFDFDKEKSKIALSKVEALCTHCKEHSNECPIGKTMAILEHYAK